MSQEPQTSASAEAAPVRISQFDPGRWNSREIAAMHLDIRRWQETVGENRFADIMDSQADLSDVETAYVRTGGAFLVAHDGTDRIVGFVGLRRDEQEADAGVLKRLVVLPERQGKGIGTQLTAAADEWAAVHGYKTLRLITGRAERARNIYQRHGFEIVGYDETHNDILMRLDMDSIRD